jgi:hypothetical protein
MIDVDSQKRAIELAGELSAAPGAGGEPIHEWLGGSAVHDRPNLPTDPVPMNMNEVELRARPRASERPRLSQPTSRRPRTPCKG